MDNADVSLLLTSEQICNILKAFIFIYIYDELNDQDDEDVDEAEEESEGAEADDDMDAQQGIGSPNHGTTAATVTGTTTHDV